MESRLRIRLAAGVAGLALTTACGASTDPGPTVPSSSPSSSAVASPTATPAAATPTTDPLENVKEGDCLTGSVVVDPVPCTSPLADWVVVGRVIGYVIPDPTQHRPGTCDGADATVRDSSDTICLKKHTP